MGRYMRRKTKNTGDLSLIDVPSLNGVLTRAKTLALQRAAAVGAGAGAGAGSYIQLRSRRLVKPTAPSNPNKSSAVSARVEINKLVAEEDEIRQEIDVKKAVDLGIDDEEASFGENVLEIEGRGRTTRETTPCSLIRDPDTIRTPGSSTKPSRSTDTKFQTTQNTTSRRIPSTIEMDEFFTGPEKQQQRLFIEKYNFDPVNDKPLKGRYEWVKLDTIKKR